MRREATEPGYFPARPARDPDNEALIDLAAACPMQADISICVHRAPDFFALNHLEGDSWTVGVVGKPGDSVVGCVAAAQREVWLDREVTRTTYVSDLKVHPRHRGTGVADALSLYARDWCAEAGAGVPILITVLGGNSAVEHRLRKRRSLPLFTAVGTIRVFTVPILWRRRPPSGSNPAIVRASSEDLKEMAALWSRVARNRQFAPVFDAAGLAQWITRAPGLSTEHYWLARDRNGRLAGFLALWDQQPLKQLVAVGLTVRGAIFRRVFNAVAPALGAARLPRLGEPLPCLSALHVCVPGDRPDVLRRLLIAAYNEFRGRYSFFSIGLDPRDPLSAALKGLWALPTDVQVYASSPDSSYTGPQLLSLPIHFETALV